ncbi:MAG: hypothetical protein ABI556_10040 [Gemmatimonadales bacterium]
MISPPPRVPWQITGNHWLTLPCIHPADASIHLAGVIHAQSRAAIEFAGSPEFLEGQSAPLARVVLSVNGARRRLGSEGIAWERELGWIPSFSCRVGSLAVRGTICAPHGRGADVSGAVIQLSIENRGAESIQLSVGLEGTLGHRQVRVVTARELNDAHSAIAGSADSIVLEGESAESPIALAIGGDGSLSVTVNEANQPSFSLARLVTLEAGATHDAAFHIAAGSERDGAAAMLRVMRRRGARALVDATRTALRQMEPSTANPAADRLIARHVFFAYFCSVARAVDDAHVYVVRSRMPWNGRGVIIRDWEALMWVLPAVQLVDQAMGRELLLRICELHGYAPGGGAHYLDGSVFEPGFSLEGASAFPIAVDSYIVQSGDDKIVEEPVLADSLYGAQEDIELMRHGQLPLYSTEVNPDGTVPELPYTAHGNAIVALALEILKHTLDEKTAEKVQDPAAVRAALLRQFSSEATGSKSVLASSSDLTGNSSQTDEPSASMYWLPYYDLIARDDSTYRRTVKKLEAAIPQDLVVRCARLVGPNGSEALDWLRRAPLDGGFAAELVDEEGKVAGNGGDAALSGLIGYTAWYAVHALGAKV